MLFRQYLPPKHNRYGIKIYGLIYSKMHYSYNFAIHCLKQPKGIFSINNKTYRCTKKNDLNPLKDQAGMLLLITA